MTCFASIEQLASGASPVRRFAAIEPGGQYRPSPVSRFAATGPGGYWSVAGEALPFH